MSEAQITLPDWLPQGLREDPKKTTVLAVLFVIFIVMVLHWCIGGPAHASAASPPSPTVAAATSSRTSIGDSSPHGTIGVRAWTKRPVTDISRNLFVIRSELFPRATSANVEAVQVRPTFWDAVEKSQAQQADENKQRFILVQNLQREASKLQVQSTMMGRVPQAIVSGTMVQEGSVVANDGGLQFRIVRIEATGVIVEREGVQLRLQMPR